MDTVNLRGGWNDLINALNVPGGLWVLLTAAGVIVVVAALLKLLWDKRRGGGGGVSSIFTPLMIGAFLAAPKVVVPILLWMIDLVINAAISLIRRSTGV
ncbi:acetate CoA-transferase subunit alpha [Nakamurella multipartita]|uniref:Uncharacterized protein n=1 Tax=Nakamurella multipartita (strain ATCC 700099 / DSM 44233 / CIP 104796 / JCM 9543 / NBRC 105858 / Y-104) TaxID=479431 RepID=C8X8M8_NAKMY|nr:acetate CoA-transferase subunit alpha [Nakamurella multipartita]ACV79083.1 hypothetical protein Namu_2737 [Nakamurella multipartita DSM 44233]